MNITYHKEPNPAGNGWVMRAVLTESHEFVMTDEKFEETCRTALRMALSDKIYSHVSTAAVKAISALKENRTIAERDMETIFHPLPQSA